MKTEIKYDGIYVVVEGSAYHRPIFSATYDNPEESELEWSDYPVILDAYDENFEEVKLTKDQESEIISGLDLNDFID